MSQEEDCSACSRQAVLPFDGDCIQKIILGLSDKYAFHVEMSSRKMAGAALATSGFAIAGSLIGRRVGGKLGAAVGGAVGGACGVGFSAVAFRHIWEEVKPQLTKLYEIVYDYVSALGVTDYQTAIELVMGNSFHSNLLAKIIRNAASAILEKKIASVNFISE